MNVSTVQRFTLCCRLSCFLISLSGATLSGRDAVSEQERHLIGPPRKGGKDRFSYGGGRVWPCGIVWYWGTTGNLQFKFSIVAWVLAKIRTNHLLYALKETNIS